MKKNDVSPPAGFKKKIGLETFVTLGAIVVIFGYLAYKMGAVTLVGTIMDLSHDLLLNTCFFVMAIAVIMGALAAIMSEFGIIELVNKLLSPLMRPLFGLPGAASLGVITTFLSDNPAILTLAKDQGFVSKFRRYQVPALCNLGTGFGMGMIVLTYISAIPTNNIGTAVLAGLLGAIVGSIVSTRLMLIQTKKYYGDTAMDLMASLEMQTQGMDAYRQVREGGIVQRFMDALLEGGKSGVDIGLGVIPGVLTICTMVMLLTNGPDDFYPGVALIPKIGERLNFILQPLFGFSSPESLSVPLTSLGSAGAAMALIPDLVSKNLAAANDVAVFAAMCMCWSGYLSTHIAMMDTLDARPLGSKAIISHTIGGLCAGISANLFFKLLTLL